MPKAEPGSAKAVGNAMKAKGLTKLRFYCQLCAKPCRDENGYKCHIESEAHMRQMTALGGSAGKVIDKFSSQFQSEFVQLLSRRYGTRRIRANLVYQEFIQERHHLHMNATRWTSLSSFVKHLGREGIVRAEENEKGWFIEWVDNSPAALARQDALQKMNRAKIDEETRGRKYLQEQIERAQREQGADGTDGATPAVGLQRDGDAPIRIGISLKPKADDGSASASTGGAPSGSAPSGSAPEATGSASHAAPVAAPAPLKLGLVSSAKAPPAVRPNAFKAASSSSSSSKAASGSGSGAGRSSMTAAERIMAEEQERRQKRESFGPQPSAKRMRM